MSRFIQPLPFSEGYEFTVAKRVTIAGVDYVPGDRLQKDGINARRLRQLYEQRMIQPALADGEQPQKVNRPAYKTAKASRAAKAAATPAPDTTSESGDPGPAETSAPGAGEAGEPEQPGDSAPQDGDAEPAEAKPLRGPLKAEHRGFGRWFVVGEGGEEGPMSKDQAEARVRAALMGA